MEKEIKDIQKLFRENSEDLPLYFNNISIVSNVFSEISKASFSIATYNTDFYISHGFYKNISKLFYYDRKQ